MSCAKLTSCWAEFLLNGFLPLGSLLSPNHVLHSLLGIRLNASSSIAMKSMSRFKYLFLSNWDIKIFNKSRVGGHCLIKMLCIFRSTFLVKKDFSNPSQKMGKKASKSLLGRWCWRTYFLSRNRDTDIKKGLVGTAGEKVNKLRE